MMNRIALNTITEKAGTGIIRLIPVLLLILTLTTPVAAAEFVLFYGNDVHGETAPCG